jgi:hypothetical protein
MTFEWDERKARANFRKHSVTFEEAASVFLDSLAITRDSDDQRAPGDEDRAETV